MRVGIPRGTPAALRRFEGLAHRARLWGGKCWINDSKANNVGDSWPPWLGGREAVGVVRCRWPVPGRQDPGSGRSCPAARSIYMYRFGQDAEVLLAPGANRRPSGC